MPTSANKHCTTVHHQPYLTDMMAFRFDRVMAAQYLTAVFEMRLTKRKAAILERVRAHKEVLF